MPLATAAYADAVPLSGNVAPRAIESLVMPTSVAVGELAACWAPQATVSTAMMATPALRSPLNLPIIQIPSS